MKKDIYCKAPFLILFLAILFAASCKKIIVSPDISAEQGKGGVSTRDTVVVRDTVIITDTVTVIDTIYVRDTTIRIDTMWSTDTIRHVDTIRMEKTVTVYDTMVVYDTVKVEEKIQVIDTIRVIDTVKVYVPVSEESRDQPTGDGILVGNGTGNLVINSQTLSGSSSTIIKIRNGTYTTITIRDLNGTADRPITIVNEGGQVFIRNIMETRNINHVVISGAGSAGTEYGFVFEDLNYRAIRMYGKMNGVTIQNMSFKNVPDYCIAGEPDNGVNLHYDGTANTRTEQFKILHCLFDNTGTITFGGQLSTSGDTGFFKDVEIAHNIFKNSEAGNLCNFTNVQDYNIHHNIVDNVNQRNNAHNGIFLMQGNGHFHNNKLTNYQGNAIRAWVYSRGSTPSTIEIYNNICYNTRKYSGFEIQQFANQIISGKTTHVNANVYNNTVGRMNTTKDWQGQLLDLYNISGTLAYYNNLGFDLYSSDSFHPVTDMINNMGSTRITEKTNNLYFATQSEAINNTSSFSSKHSGVGASLNLN